MDTNIPQCQGRGERSGVVVFLYLLGMTLMFAHLGSRPPHARPPPAFVLPRLLVMAAVAVLVWHRGLPNTTTRSTNVMFEVGVVMTACSLAIAYVWHVLEVVIYVILFLALSAVESMVDIPLTCDDCIISFQLQFLAMSIFATLLLILALHFVKALPFAQGIVKNCVDQSLGVRFWSKVKIVFINPKSHTPEHPMETDLSAPGGGDRNPVVKPPASPNHVK